MYNDEYFELMRDLGVNRNPNRLKYYYEQFFRGYDFTDKYMLDIGGGSGLLTFYAVAHGAKEVICLEPENAGSTSGISDIFNKIKNAGSYNNADILEKKFQDYQMKNRIPFDMITSNASINHLDEEAVIDVNINVVSKNTYKVLVKKMYDMLAPGGVLIIADVSRKNIFNDIGLKSPICKTIEWHKHQNPDIWIRLIESVGFILKRKEYMTFNVMGEFGKKLLGNSIFSYIYGSLFLLEFRK
jgi:SAM-dependent methyltransferase